MDCQSHSLHEPPLKRPMCLFYWKWSSSRSKWFFLLDPFSALRILATRKRVNVPLAKYYQFFLCRKSYRIDKTVEISICSHFLALRVHSMKESSDTSYCFSWNNINIQNKAWKVFCNVIYYIAISTEKSWGKGSCIFNLRNSLVIRGLRQVRSIPR